ncbi:hypothetical protein AUP68_01561 [Ilyonectria robusta]
MSAPNDKPSTLQSYVDSATGTLQSALGSITGSTGDKTEGEARKDKAELENEASHAAVKVPGGTVSTSGVARDDPNRTEGSWNQTVGAAKETVGGLIGNQSLKNAGRQQNLEGQQQEARGQLSDLGSGIGDRVQGTLGGAVAGLTGDKEGQAHYNSLHDEGKTKQRGVEADLQKQAEAEHKHIVCVSLAPAGCSYRRLGLTRDGAPDGEDAVAGFVEEPGLQTERVMFLRHAGPAEFGSVAARETASREAKRRCRGGERNQVGYCNDKLTVHGARMRSCTNRMAHDKVVELWKSAYARSKRHILPLLCLAR